MITEYNTEFDENNLPVLKKIKSVNADLVLNNPENIVEMMNTVFKASKQTEEHIWLLAFNAKIKLLGIFEIAHGTVCKCETSPREVMMKSLLCGAVNIILVHNHPSQDASPSRDDVDFTNRIKKVCNIMNIKLLDHIIIGTGYKSMLQEEIL